jgi:prepilin-type N-terminal cleavage/methylation domain-containing protein
MRRARRRFSRADRRGFTLIELLIVVAIVSILAGLVPAFRHTKKPVVGNCDSSEGRSSAYMILGAVLAVPVVAGAAKRSKVCTFRRSAASKILICGKTVFGEDSRSLSS